MPTEKKQAKYDDETKAITKRSQEFRGRANAVAPLTVIRVRKLLDDAGKTPDQIVKSFKSIAEAKEFASGDKTVKPSTLVTETSKKHDDPFGKGRGLVAICLALREQPKTS